VSGHSRKDKKVKTTTPRKVIINAATLIVLLAVFTSARADVKLPHVFTDKMVLQRDIQIPVWGWAQPAEKITLTFNNNTVTTTADSDGKWLAHLPPQKAGGPFEMTIAANNTVTLTDILVGELWLCSGQSNMEMGLGLITNTKTEVANANYPNIRLFNVKRKTSHRPLDDVDGQWKICNPKNIYTDNVWEGWPRGFSAVAYFFGREIHKELNVPVGLIASSWGGTPIETWTPPEGFASVPELSDILEQIKQADQKYNEQVEKTLTKFETWLTSARKDFQNNQITPTPPALPAHLFDDSKKPTGLYNAMIHPLIPFAIRGAIWYQGEANLSDGMLYYHKMNALITGWRNLWKQGDFPFYYVQIAPFRYRWGIPDPQRVPLLWEAQTEALKIPNTGMAVTLDISDLDDIHPKNKQDVGKRLALWALAKTYGFSDIVYSGPLYKSHSVEGDKIRIHFDHVAEGLRSADGMPLTWFEIAGPDKVFKKAKAEINGDTVIVQSEKVPQSTAVRFAWHEEAEPNLINSCGLPAAAFRTEKY